MRLVDIPTPALVLDKQVLERNVQRLRDRLAPHRVLLRPHLKTLKSVEAARAAGFDREDGLCVSTLREAEAFFAAGWRDLTYTTAIEPAKIDRIADMQQGGGTLRLLVENVDVARRLADDGRRFSVYAEVDCGVHRTGVGADSEDLIQLGRLLEAAPGVFFLGVLTWSGHSYGAASVEDIKAIAEQERTTALHARARLNQAGIPCRELSVGSTPAAFFGSTFEGITEVRAGVFMAFDLFQTELGCCDRDDLALSVLAAVVSSGDRSGRVIVDAGFLAMSLDRGNSGHFGLVADIDGKLMPGWEVESLNQEHGFLRWTGCAPMPELRPGTRLRILPNHACATAGGHDRYSVVAGSRTVVAEWPRISGW